MFENSTTTVILKFKNILKRVCYFSENGPKVSRGLVTTLPTGLYERTGVDCSSVCAGLGSALSWKSRILLDWTCNMQQNTQCTYEVILSRVRVTTVAMEKQCVLNIMSEVFHIFCACPALPIFTHYLSNDTIFEKRIIEQKICGSIFSTTFVRNISHFEKNSARYHK
jgi:hypothetical protein